MKRDWLFGALVACALATLLHHAHNAAFLDHYPNMPAWLSAPMVYAAWVGATGIGIAGYWLWRTGPALAGYVLMIAYGCYGLDGLVHYVFAPVSAHTAAMNLSIWLEAVAAAVLLVVLLRIGREKGPDPFYAKPAITLMCCTALLPSAESE